MSEGPSRTTTTVFCVSAVLVAVLAFVFARHVQTNDLINFVVPWFQQIVQDGFSATAGSYSNYTPTYLYVLAAVAPLHQITSDITLIKLVSQIFNFLAAFLVYLIVANTTAKKRLALISAAGFLILPTVVVNSVYWGQCDIIYTTFVLGFLFFSLQGKPKQGLIFLGVAFAFKLQTIFIAPFLLYLILRRRVRLPQLAIVPLVYVVAMFPAWLLGRPAFELAMIYVGQAKQKAGRLSLNAPNPFEIIHHLVDYRTGMVIGLALATIAGLGLAVFSYKRLPDNRQTMLLVSTASVVLMPFLLPKMHERYFFLADVLSYVLAFTLGRTWPLAVAMQIGSLSAYSGYLLRWKSAPSFGAGAVGIAVVGIIWLCWRQSRNRFRDGSSPRTSGPNSA